MSARVLEAVENVRRASSHLSATIARARAAPALARLALLDEALEALNAVLEAQLELNSIIGEQWALLFTGRES